MEIKVATTGLNFRDVMWSLRLLPEEALEDGYAGALENRMKLLGPGHVSGILPRGGTILGSSNRDQESQTKEQEQQVLHRPPLRDCRNVFRC